MIDGVEVTMDREAVVVTARAPLAVLSSAVVGGGLAGARAIVNLHVPKDFELGEVDARLGAFARRRGIPLPWVGLLTSAWTEKAEMAEAEAHGIRAVAVVTVGLSNRIAAGVDRTGAWAPSTINTVVVVDAAPEPAAMVNAVITATEVKTALLAEAGVRCGDGLMASGTSTDAVVVAATGNGRACRFGGPVSELGSVVARAVREAMGRGVGRWLEDNA
ncbi:MAG: adenosylcobinamide amidohydrolase [Actinobacteria bacterium]|nr:adenosylcobinamide amidohydrolase [Actinomycetota bacterium]